MELHQVLNVVLPRRLLVLQSRERLGTAAERGPASGCPVSGACSLRDGCRCLLNLGRRHEGVDAAAFGGLGLRGLRVSSRISDLVHFLLQILAEGRLGRRAAA